MNFKNQPEKSESTNLEMPLSADQQRIWFIEQLEPGTTAFNLPIAIYLKGKLDVESLKKSINECIQRQKILRTTFPTVGGRPVQVVSPSLSLPLEIVNLQKFQKSEKGTEINYLANHDRRFNLENGPLIRARLLRMSTEESVLLFSMHSMICDSWSKRIIIDEIANIYSAFSKNQTSSLKELAVQYADFAIWQREWLQSEIKNTQIDFWKRQLTGIAPIFYLSSFPPILIQEKFASATQSIKIKKPLFDALVTLSKQKEVTIFVTLLAVFKILLYKYSRHNDIWVGTVVPSRSRPELENLIGPFEKQIILRTDLSGEPNFFELLSRVNKVTFEAYTHQDVPFETIVDSLQLKFSLCRMIMFEVNKFKTYEMSDLTMSIMEIETGTSPFDLVMSIGERMNGLDIKVKYRIDIFDNKAIKNLLVHFQKLLSSIVENPFRSISALSSIINSEQCNKAANNKQSKDIYQSENDLRFAEKVTLYYGKTSKMINSIMNKVKNIWNSLAKISSIQRIGFLLLLITVFIATIGILNQHGNLYLGEFFGNILQDFYANASTELLSIVITILIIDRIYRRYDTKREKEKLILQMGSPDNAFAIEALRMLRVLGWLEDGSLHGADLRGANLNGARLGQANLKNVNLDDSNLNGAELRETNLQGASLNNTNLKDANLCEANLQGIDTYIEAQLIQAKALWGALMPNGKRYNGRFNLDVDILYARLDFVEIDDNEQMAIWYGVSLEDYKLGQEWALLNLEKFKEKSKIK